MLHHQRDDVCAFYLQLKGEVIVGFEASGYSAWFEVGRCGPQSLAGDAAAIRHPAPRRQKNDRRDAELILDLLLQGEFPRLYRFSAASRAALRQLRYRDKLVKLRTIVKNSLQAIAINGGLPLRSKLLTERGIERLQALAFARCSTVGQTFQSVS